MSTGAHTRTEQEGGARPRLRARADVQGLRGLAVGLVVLDHAGLSQVPGGFVGVDVFFVLSGYLISSLLLRELSTTGRVRIGAFYARRARRILPAATVVLATITGFAALRLPVGRAAEVAEDVVWSTLFVSNVRFARQGTDYFGADGQPSPVRHFWSLAVEEQFYLLWPAVLCVVALMAMRSARRRHTRVDARIPQQRSGQQGRGTGALPALVALVAAAWLASFVWSVLLTSLEPAAAYFSTPARVWELATGTLLALGAGVLVRLPWAMRSLLAPLGLGAVLLAATTYGPHTPFPGWQAALPVLGTAAVLAAGADGRAPGAGRLLTARPLTWLGDVSYSLYLWHWPVLLLGARYVPEGWTGRVLLVGVALTIATASYHGVEAPFRRPRRLWSTTPRALVLWPVALVVVLGVVGWSGLHRDAVLEARARQAASFEASSVPSRLRTERDGARIHDLLAESLDRAAVGGPIPFPLRNDLGALDADRPTYPGSCYAQSSAASSLVCSLGDHSAASTVVMLGDSHAQMWLTGIDALGRRDGFQVVPLIKFGCPPSDLRLRQLDQPGDPEYTACYRWRGWALDQVRALHPDVVVVVSRAPPTGLVVVEGSAPEEVWGDALASLATALRGVAGRVVVGGDVSYLHHDPATCVGRSDTTMTDCTEPMDPATASFNAASRQAAARAGADYADLNQLVCLHGRCPMVVGQVITYHDAQHVSTTWAVEVADELEALLGLPTGSGPHPDG